ncbi:Curli production assembly/transport component CsgG [Enhygromyxa salina]|uniref:Curli production assembly/transport component CsgG n=1 Tax=Enhygromyxa salina TaxID=215803 RepID=A0A2S9XBN5_9BACT|nr:CsgG/HfaB family protein [Enhygromyxa salina]PRP90274.1 Curli production assembly/transport component CsgG [Enhygromyxa salina]
MNHASVFRSSLCLVLLTGVAAGTLGCKPKAVRGGPGTENPNLDEGALSTTLDRKDINYLVDENLEAMFASAWWARDVQGSMADPPVVAIWPIKNATSMHLDDQMLTLLSQIETTMVNSGAVSVVSRERQAEMVAEAQLQNSDLFDPATAARLGAQLGAKYYITGKVTSTEERFNKERRVQYSLFIQVIEVETSVVKFQFTSERSKAIVR